jgi:hypothetical protein
LRESYPKYKNQDDMQEFQKAQKEIKRAWLILFLGVLGVIIAFAMLTR